MPAPYPAVKALRPAESATLFSQLHRGIAAGLTPAQLSNVIKLPGRQRQLGTLRRLLARGLPLSAAGRKAGVFSSVDASLLHSSEAGGVLESALAALAEREQKFWLRQRRIRARLVLPAAVLLLALAVRPLPALIGGQIGTFGYGAAVTAPVLLLLVAAAVLPLACSLLRSLPGARALLDGIRLQMPLTGQWHRRRQLHGFCRQLGLLYRAGIPMLDAVRRSAACLDNEHLRRCARALAGELDQGQPLTTALMSIPQLEPAGRQLLSIGDVSGRLDAMLLHFVALEQQALDRHDEAMADWLPRIAYLGVMTFMAANLLG